jgi:hypothetical protein
LSATGLLALERLSVETDETEPVRYGQEGSRGTEVPAPASWNVSSKDENDEHDRQLKPEERRQNRKPGEKV